MPVDFEKEAQIDREWADDWADASRRARRKADQERLPAKLIAEAAIKGVAANSGADVSPASPIGALVGLAESVEAGVSTPADIEARMDRYPELRDVTVPTGIEARYPELSEAPPEVAAEVGDQEEDGYSR